MRHESNVQCGFAEAGSHSVMTQPQAYMLPFFIGVGVGAGVSVRIDAGARFPTTTDRVGEYMYFAS